MAQWLAKLGAEAFKPQKVNGVWRKAVLSPLAAARLRKQYILEGREWPYEKPPSEPKPIKCKGHKHDKLKAQRVATIEKNMEEMPQRIAAYRESRKLKDVSLLDRLLMTSKEIRAKNKGK